MARLFNNLSKKAIVLIFSITILVVAGLSSTLAVLVFKTPPINNSFEAGKIVLTQTDTTITNSEESNVAVYIRVAIVVNYQDKTDNSIFHEGAVEGVDYTVLDAQNWIRSADGFYYYAIPLQIGDTTSPLPLVSRNLLNEEEHKHEYAMVSSYVAVAIQANKTEAVVDTWGVSVDENGIIVAVG